MTHPGPIHVEVVFLAFLETNRREGVEVGERQSSLVCKSLEDSQEHLGNFLVLNIK